MHMVLTINGSETDALERFTEPRIEDNPRCDHPSNPRQPRVTADGNSMYRGGAYCQTRRHGLVP